MLTNIKEYLDTVCEQIRFQKAHHFIKEELHDHIKDQAEAFVLKGMDKKTATQKAIEEMGDPILVGTELDRVHRPKLEWSFILFLMLFLTGNVIMRWTVWKASLVSGYPIPSIGMNNIMGIFIGIAAMVAFYYIDFTILADNSKAIYTAYVIFMAVLYFVINTFGIQGSSIWINISVLSIVVPPLIYLFPIVLIALLYDCRGKSYSTILWCGASFLIPAFFSMHMRCSTATFIIAVVSFILIITAIFKNWFSVNKLKALLMIIIPVIAFVVFLYFNTYSFRHRLESLYIGIKDPYGIDWYKNILQQAVKGAHLFGVGEVYSFYSSEGNLIQMTPENSYQGAEYFVNYALHYFGWIVFVLFLSMYVFFIVRGFVLAHKQKSQLGSMTAFSILLTISMISLWNIFCTSGFFIVANPLELPFFSGGGTTNIIYFIMMGVLLSVFRTGKYVKDYGKKRQKKGFMGYRNGELTFTIRLKK